MPVEAPLVLDMGDNALCAAAVRTHRGGARKDALAGVVGAVAVHLLVLATMFLIPGIRGGEPVAAFMTVRLMGPEAVPPAGCGQAWVETPDNPGLTPSGESDPGPGIAHGPPPPPPLAEPGATDPPGQEDQAPVQPPDEASGKTSPLPPPPRRASMETSERSAPKPEHPPRKNSARPRKSGVNHPRPADEVRNKADNTPPSDPDRIDDPEAPTGNPQARDSVPGDGDASLAASGVGNSGTDGLRAGVPGGTDIAEHARGLKEVDKPPAILSTVEPDYPHSARSRGVSGKVVVKILIGRQGEVQEAIVIDATPPDVFNGCVLDAVRKWRFKPGEFKGEPVPTWVVLPVKFRLSG